MGVDISSEYFSHLWNNFHLSSNWKNQKFVSVYKVVDQCLSSVNQSLEKGKVYCHLPGMQFANGLFHQVWNATAENFP